MTGVIYGLHDGDGEVWYVGQTRRSMARRLTELKSRARRGDMENAALSARLRLSDPVVRELESTDSLDDAEAWWIEKLKPECNRQSGGSSGFTLPNSTRARIRGATMAQLQRHGHPMQGRKHSPETIAKMTAARRRRAKITEMDVGEIRENPESLTQRKLAEKYGVSQQHISDITNHRRW